MNTTQTPQLAPTENTISIPDLVRNNTRFILRFTAVCAVLILGYSFVMRQTFEAGAKLVATDTKSNSMSSLLGGIPAFVTGGAGAGASSAMSMVEIVQSRTNADYIIRTCRLDTVWLFRDQTREERQKAVLELMSVDAKRTSGVITVSCLMQTPFLASQAEQRLTAEIAAQMCNAAIAGLDSANRSKTNSTARKARMYIERVLATNHGKIDSLQKTMIEYQKKYHIYTPETQAEALVTNAVSIGTELAKAETELRLGREQFQENTPYVKALETKVSSLQAQFAQAQNGGIGANDQLSIPVGTLPEISMGYVNLVRDIKILEQVNAYLESQRMQESIQEERDVPTVQVIDPAFPPDKKSSPSRVWMLVLGSVVAALVSIMIVFLRQTFFSAGQSTNTATPAA
ncbi:MAG: hypothetical protein RL156_1785 [Bacteroidota bacterium]|jgi:uncharacterized protein involved in exopolysaccharide biosynthesis